MTVEALIQGFNLDLSPEQINDPEVVAGRRDWRHKMNILHSAAIRRESDNPHLREFLASAQSLGLPEEINMEFLYAMNFAHASAVCGLESLLAEKSRTRSSAYEFGIHNAEAEKARQTFEEYNARSTVSEERRAELAAIASGDDFVVAVMQVFETTCDS